MIVPSAPQRSISHQIEELERVTAQQKALDAERKAEAFTGHAQDLVSGDWTVYVDGDIIGWAPSPRTALMRIAEARAAQWAEKCRTNPPRPDEWYASATPRQRACERYGAMNPEDI